MAYIGKEPLTGFVSLKRQDITGDGTASYTLDHAVSSINDILVYVNHVKQDPSSMTVSGTSLTMGGNVASTDDFYVIFLGQALQTVTPPDDSVTAAKLNDDIISGQTALTVAPADTDEFLVSDAGTLKRLDYSLIKASPAMELISTNNVTSATSEVELDISSSDYTHFKVIISGLMPATNSARLNAQVKQSGSYVSSAGHSYIIGSDYVRDTNTASQSASEQATNGTKIVVTSEMKNTTAETNTVDMLIYNPSATTNYVSMTWSNTNYGSVLTNLHRKYDGSAIVRTNTVATTDIKFYMDSGNISRGLFKLYGIK
jgi:hypothetical protein